MPLMNHSASFVLSTNFLDKCPKCGQNICEHTSIADAINLQNSVSQDFSTYSSDSSLIKQLFTDPNCLNASAYIHNKSKSSRISMSAINKLSESFFLNQYQKQKQQLHNSKECSCLQMYKNFNSKQICYNDNGEPIISPNSSSYMPCFNLRPLSCQVMIIDNETTDKLLKDFFDASSTNLHTCCPHHGHIHQKNQQTHQGYSSITASIMPENCLDNGEQEETCDSQLKTLTKTISGISSISDKNNNSPPWHSSPINKNNNNAEMSNSHSSIKLVDDGLNRISKSKGKDKTQNKRKFSNFRLFLKSTSLNQRSSPNNETISKKSTHQKKAMLKSSTLVNCLTSSTSSSSSSCEELRHKVFLNKSNSSESSTSSSSRNSSSCNNKLKKSSKYHRPTNKIKEIDENDMVVDSLSQPNNFDDIRVSKGTSEQEDRNENSEFTRATELYPSSTLNFAPLKMNDEIQKNRNDSKLSLCKSIISLNSNSNKQLQGHLNENENEDEDNSDYNDIQNIELCPIVISDIDSEFQDEGLTAKNNNQRSNSRKGSASNSTHFTNCNNNYNSNNFNNNNIINNHNNTTNINNISTIISVPLNNYLFYNYEKRKESAEKQKNENDQENTSSSTKESMTKTKNSSKIFCETPGPTLNDVNATDINKTKYTDLNQHIHHIYTTKPNTITNGSAKLINSQCYPAQTLKNKNRKEPLSKNRLSYFSTCSSACGENEAMSGTSAYDQISKTDCSSSHNNFCDTYTTTTVTTDVDESNRGTNVHRYHCMSIVFILIGLFTLNCIQEYFVMFYYFNTEQFYWLVYSVIGLFSGQTLTLILSLLTEIDLLNSIDKLNNSNRKNSPGNAIYFPSLSLSSSSSLPPMSPTKDKFIVQNNNNKEKETHDETLLTEQSGCGAKKQSNSETLNENTDIKNTIKPGGNQHFHHLLAKASFNQELYLVFKNPFSKLFLLIPGYLPISVYIQFFKHVFNYRKSSGNSRFKLEFQLALYLFYNGIFHSLPLAIINSCYFASTTTTHSLSYYSDLLSIFSLASSSSSTAIFVDDLNLERRNQLVLILVSIFISISIGICLFTTYFELMKQMNYISLLRMKSGIYQCSDLSPFSNSNSTKYLNYSDHRGNKLGERKEDSVDSNKKNLGLIEILVYFCYKFCLISSRLSILAIFWYLFQGWLILAVIIHVTVSYTSSLCFKDCFNLNTHYSSNRIRAGKKHNNESHENMIKKVKNLSSNDKKGFSKGREFDLIVDSSLTSTMASSGEHVLKLENEISSKENRSKLSKRLSFFIICLLGCVDLFMNQLSEIQHIRKVILYYVFYFVQNFVLLTYWFVRSITSERLKSKEKHVENNQSSATSTFSSTSNEIYLQNKNNNFLFIVKTLTTVSSNLKSDVSSNFWPNQYSCYATLIYLFIILFTIFGLILKFLHLHILRKRYRRL